MILTPLKDMYPRYSKRYSTPTYLNYFLHYEPLKKKKHKMTYFLQIFNIKNNIMRELWITKNV